MITYYSTTPHGYTFRRYLKRWASPEFAADAKWVGYSQLDLAAAPKPGLHVFTDFERLLPPERALVTRLARRLRQRDDMCVLGDPSRWKGRYELLTRLADDGINDFRAYLADDVDPGQVKYPVFLRWANDHHGSLGGVIHDRETLEQRLAGVANKYRRRMKLIGNQLLVVEQLDALSPDGLYRKYSFYRVGDQYVPANMVAAENWITKRSKVVTDELVREEQDFLDNPRDLDVIKHAFEVAGIEYGRVDWGYVNGRPQIWEINTNPMIAPRLAPHDLRLQSQLQMGAQVGAALQRLEAMAGPPGTPRAIIPAPERWAWRLIKRGGRAWDARRA